LKTKLTILIAIALGIIAGCERPVEVKEPLQIEKQPPAEAGELFTVDFKEGQTLRYKFGSSRKIVLVWGPGETKSKSAKDKDTVDESSESMEMVVAYTPVKVDPYGLTTIKATCESVNVQRTARKGQRPLKDAVESLGGKSFTFTVRPTGKIEDYSELEKLIKETGEKAFRPPSAQGRVKEPDMITDFITTQWFLWDSISSIEKPTEGVSAGQSWKSKLLLPAPMVMWKARDVTYRLDRIQQTEKGRVAAIRSSYSLADSVPPSWPIPYSGSFQVSGRFGLLRGFQVQDLQGTGEELFNMDAGRVEQYGQQYKMQVSAFLLFPLPGTNPQISIEQRLTMQLLGD